ncbi:MAG TPA: hypothetical protein VFA04_00710 [Bryobacteraceae bacterium]|nr:hypothetical protein [Bryobacteraceae bacterium]
MILLMLALGIFPALVGLFCSVAELPAGRLRRLLRFLAELVRGTARSPGRGAVVTTTIVVSSAPGQRKAGDQGYRGKPHISQSCTISTTARK